MAAGTAESSHPNPQAGAERRELTGKALLNDFPSLLIQNPSQTVPATGDQAFKYMSLWEPFSLKPPHHLEFY